MNVGKRRRISLVLSALAIFLMGAEAPKGCEGRKRSTNPNQVNPETVVFVVSMEAVCGKNIAPCEVTMEARNWANPKEAEIVGPIPVASGAWKNTLEYNKGWTVQITLTLKGSKPGKKEDAIVSIADGENAVTEFLLGRTARATLTTNRG